MPSEPKKTVRVRIAVAVTEEGSWAALGWPKMPDDGRFDLVDYLPGDADRPHVYHWIEADVPVPTAATVEGMVVE